MHIVGVNGFLVADVRRDLLEFAVKGTEGVADIGNEHFVRVPTYLPSVFAPALLNPEQKFGLSWVSKFDRCCFSLEYTVSLLGDNHHDSRLRSLLNMGVE